MNTLKQELEHQIKFDYEILSIELGLKNIYLKMVKDQNKTIYNISLSIENAKEYHNKKHVSYLRDEKVWWKKQLKDSKEHVKYYTASIQKYKNAIQDKKLQLSELLTNETYNNESNI
jgi:hypothetical protein